MLDKSKILKSAVGKIAKTAVKMTPTYQGLNALKNVAAKTGSFFKARYKEGFGSDGKIKNTSEVKESLIKGEWKKAKPVGAQTREDLQALRK